MPQPTCMQCNSTDIRILAHYEDYVAAASVAQDERKSIYGYMQSHPETAFKNFLACNHCGVVRVDPLPTTATLMDFYQSYYASGAYSLKQEKKIRRTLARLKHVRRHVSSGRFLDVGCNVGFAVEAARRAGFDAHGIEIDSKAVAYASKHFPQNTFTASTIEDFKPDAPFDLVYCTEVLEHVIDPVAFVGHLARLVKPKGYLMLTTPDAGHWRVPSRFVEWPEVKPLEHINWQTRRSLDLLLRGHGFETPRIRFNLKPNLRILARRTAAA